MSEKPEVASSPGGDGFFLVRGKLTELHVEMGRENLLARIDKHYRAKTVLTGAGAVVGDMFGQAANAAMLAMYDGEDTQNFVALLDGQVICGQFGGAEMLHDAGRVDAVVSSKDGVLVAHAIKSPSKGLLWVTHPWGVEAEGKANLKLAAIGFAGVTVVGSILGPVLGLFDARNLETVLWGWGLFALLCWGLAAWANSGMKALAGPSTEMFRLLGFENPARVNLTRYGIKTVSIREHLRDRTPSEPTQGLGVHQYRDVYCYRKAVEDGHLVDGPVAA